MNILVINCGSSSLKFQLIDSETEKCIAKGICERIGIEGSQITYTPAGGEKEQTVTPMPDHTEAIRLVLEALTNEKTGVVKSLDEIGAVGHRIVHGGEKFASSTVITDEAMKAIEECNDLAPLHNPANLIGIDACKELMPDVPMVGVFDTAFHQTMPKKAFLYGLPYEYYEKYKVRRYGFHGTSHSFVSKRTAEFLGMDLKNSKIIVAVSHCAILSDERIVRLWPFPHIVSCVGLPSVHRVQQFVLYALPHTCHRASLAHPAASSCLCSAFYSMACRWHHQAVVRIFRHRNPCGRLQPPFVPSSLWSSACPVHGQQNGTIPLHKIRDTGRKRTQSSPEPPL